MNVRVRFPPLARMNIFVVDESPVQAARDLCNKHVVKMIVESTQILCTAYRIKMQEKLGLSADNREFYPKLYKSTHKNHPSIKWVLESVHNVEWLWQHLSTLEEEYRLRYKKFHKSSIVIEELSEIRYEMWNCSGNWTLHTSFVQCMPDKYKCHDAVKAYRDYYRNEKASFAKWLPRTQPPSWWSV